MKQKGYTLMYHTIHGNVLGVVIAPKGTENAPKEKRPLVWRMLTQPFVPEIAEHEPYPAEDMAKALADLIKFAQAEGLSLNIDKRQ